jgi:hypothetical protein
MYELSYESKPQFISDLQKKQTHVVLTEDDFCRLRTELPDPECLYYLRVRKRRGQDVFAKALIDEEVVVVIRGATLGDPSPSFPQKYKEERARRTEQGYLGEKDGRLIVLKTFHLKNPSEAACIISGNSQSGNEYWVDANDNKLGDSIMARRR